MAFLSRAKDTAEPGKLMTRPSDILVMLHALGADSPTHAVAVDQLRELIDVSTLDGLLTQRVVAEGQPGKVYVAQPRSPVRFIAVIALCVLWAGIIAWLIARVYLGGTSGLFPPIKVGPVLHSCVGALLAAALAQSEWTLRMNSMEVPDDLRGSSTEPWARAGIAFVLHIRQRYLAVVSVCEAVIVLLLS